MTKSKDISPEKRYSDALKHVLQAERNINAVTINARSLSFHLKESKKLIINLLSTLSQGDPTT